jgi:tetratricopeptide (TPR) repeat protein
VGTTKINQTGHYNIYIENVADGGRVILNNRHVPFTLNTPPPIALPEIFGRKDDLLKVKQLLGKNDKIVLINGIGGIGKTTLAKAFVKRFRKGYKHAAWIDVSGKITEAFVYNLQLLDSLQLTEEISKLPKEDLITKGFELVVNRMRMLDGSNLLVVDNINSESESKEVYSLLSIGENWKVITTSRTHLDGFTPYELDIMEEDAAISFFKHHYRRETDETLIRQILKDIDYHTLLIEVLAKTGQRNKLKLIDIARKIKKKGLNVVTRTSISIPHSSKRIYKIMAYLQEIFKLSGLNVYEKEVLTSLSVLPSVHAHYQSLIDLLQVPKSNKERFINALNSLHDKGWINEKNDSFKIHQVVQEVLRKILTPDTLKCRTLFDTYLQNFNPRLNSNSIANAYLLSYAEHFIDYMKNEKSAELAKLCAWIGVANEILGKFAELLKYDLRLVKIRKQLFDANSMEVADAYNNLGLTYVHFRSFRQALYYQNLALKIRHEIIPKEHSYFGRSYINLNFTYEKMTQYKIALKYGILAEKNFLNAIEHPVPGDTEPEIIRLNLARTYNNLGYDFQKLGDNQKALEYQHKSIEIREELLEPMDPFLSESYYNASYTYYVIKQYNEASLYADKALKIRQIILHGGHEQLVKTVELKKAIVDAINGTHKVVDH